MKSRLFSAILLVPLGIALSPTVNGADAGDASPYDTNPACMERTTDASTGACVNQVEGTPRHRYPPRGQAAAANNTGAGAGSAATTGTAKGSSVSRGASSGGK